MNKKKDNTINISNKAIVIIIILLIILIIFIGIYTLKNSSQDNNLNNKYENLPEKCIPPSGESISSWKEHLGHHVETQNCLKYFN